MAHVDVKSSAVQQKTAIARRLLVIAVMQIDRAELRLAENMVLHADRPGIGRAGRLLVIDEAAIFGLNADDAVHGGDSVGHGIGAGQGGIGPNANRRL